MLAGVRLCGLPHPSPVEDLPVEDRARRVLLDLHAGLCVLDQQRTFVRGLLELTLPGSDFEIPLWVELPRESFRRMLDHWNDRRRHVDPLTGSLSDRLAGSRFEGLPTWLHLEPVRSSSRRPPRLELADTDERRRATGMEGPGR